MTEIDNNNKAILHYFDARGLAEIVRLSMAASGIQVKFLLYFFKVTNNEEYFLLNKVDPSRYTRKRAIFKVERWY